MKPEIKAQFVHNLRVTRVPQVTDAELVIFPHSARTQGIDAWGVLCALSPWFASIRREHDSETNFFHTEREAILKWSGLTLEELDELIEANDILGLSFSQIADMIEGEWD